MEVIPGPGCGSSYVGRTGRPTQPLTIGPQCFTDRTIMHEFIHALGFDHEHNRPDRDDYIKVNLEVIGARCARNYQIARGSLTFGVPYDGRSVMHYFSTACGSKERPAITSKVRVRDKFTSNTLIRSRASFSRFLG